jgi:hypothetical protein
MQTLSVCHHYAIRFFRVLRIQNGMNIGEKICNYPEFLIFHG